MFLNTRFLERFSQLINEKDLHEAKMRECRLKIVKITKATRSGFTVHSLLILAVSKINQTVTHTDTYKHNAII